MLAKLVRMLIMFILEKIGLIDSSKVEDNNAHFREDTSFRNGHAGKYDTSNTVDGTWREVNEEDDEKAEPSEEADPEPKSLQDHMKELSRAADGIRHPKIRELAFHILILAGDIINEHDTGHGKSRNYGQFERYYIPTVTSVVSNYQSIESKGMATAAMQKDVLAYLESCGDAFAKMYNNMFSDDIMKMEVQMEAMDIIMKRDGLL